MRFDRKKFYDNYRTQFGKLNALQVDGLNRLLNAIENDPFITQIPEAAYLLATPKHETAHTFQPIHEYGGKSYFTRRYGGQTRKGKELGNDTPEEGYYYAGKGDVQLTGESNYERAEVALRREYPEVVADFERRTGKVFDLTIGDQANDTLDPQNALDPAISYAVMSYGMRTGMFTGRKLSEFIRRGKKDYVEARRTVNRKDKAGVIARYAEKFEAILNASKMSAAANTMLGSDSAAAKKPDTTGTGAIAQNPDGPQAGSSDPPPTVKTEQIVVAPDGTTTKTTIFERLTDWSGKLNIVTGFKDSLNPFTPSISPISGTSGLATVVTKLGGWAIMLSGLIFNRWTALIAGMVLIGFALGYLASAKRNAAKRTGGDAPLQQTNVEVGTT